MSQRIVALAGGVGGSKLAEGLAQCLPTDHLAIVVNTADDFDHFGLRVCPDLDTVCYTLAGMANPETGWGRSGETWHAMESVEALGGPAWFRLGDRDLGTHLERTRRLRSGASLTEVVAHFCRSWGVRPRVLPMSDDPIATVISTDQGDLDFQKYFVELRCEPQVRAIRFAGAERAQPAAGVLEAIADADLIVICPSNPWVSVDPILAVPGLKKALQEKTVLAVSPIIGGKAVKGPAAKIFTELGVEPSANAVTEHYDSLLAGIVIDTIDQEQSLAIEAMGVRALVTDIWMKTRADRKRLAGEVIAFGKLLTEPAPV